MSRRDSRSRLLATGIPTLSLFVLAAALFAAPAAAYEAVQVNEGGTINGKVVYQGEVTTRKIVPTKRDLTPESLPKLLALIRPQDNEWRHLKVEWLTDVVAARKKAVAEDKPIVICYTGGAGYNEPLGVC